MPTYEFHCLTCCHQFENMQKTHDPNPSCPECKDETERQISLSSFHLKGQGLGVGWICKEGIGMKKLEFEMEMFGGDMSCLETVCPTKITDEKGGKFVVEFPKVAGTYIQVKVTIENEDNDTKNPSSQM